MLNAGLPASTRKQLAGALVLVGLLGACGGSGDSRHLPRSSADSVDSSNAPAVTGITTVGDTVAPNAADPVVTRPTTPGASSDTLPPQQVETVPPVTQEFRDPIVFDPLVIQDPMANNVDALSVLVPQGWQATASVQWIPEWERVAHLQTTLYDPFSGLILDWLPIQDFMYFQPPAGFEVPIGGNYQGKAYVPPIYDPAEFVAQFWASSTLPELQAATLVDIQQVPAVADEFVRGFGGAATASAYRMRYEYVQDGQPWEEEVFFALLYAGSGDFTSWYVNFAYTIRGPRGQIDLQEPLTSTIVASRLTTPQWEATYRIVQQLFTQGIRQQMADTVAFGKALAAYNAEIFALQQQVTADRQASQDRIADLRGQSLEGVQTYTDPVSGTLVQLPVGWNEYWVNQNGEYITSDQPGFDPNTLNQGVWQQLIVQA